MSEEFKPPKVPTPKIPSFEMPKVPAFEMPKAPIFDTSKIDQAARALARPPDTTFLDRIASFQPPEIEPTHVETLANIAEANYAHEFCERLNAQFKAFDESLDEEHEIGVRLVSYGQTVVFHVSNLGFHNPSLIFFYGETPDGNRVQLIQHVSQISFILMAMPKPDPEQPRRAFGFEQGTSVPSSEIPSP